MTHFVPLACAVGLILAGIARGDGPVDQPPQWYGVVTECVQSVSGASFPRYVFSMQCSDVLNAESRESLEQRLLQWRAEHCPRQLPVLEMPQRKGVCRYDRGDAVFLMARDPDSVWARRWESQCGMVTRSQFPGKVECIPPAPKTSWIPAATIWFGMKKPEGLASCVASELERQFPVLKKPFSALLGPAVLDDQVVQFRFQTAVSMGQERSRIVLELRAMPKSVWQYVEEEGQTGVFTLAMSSRARLYFSDTEQELGALDLNACRQLITRPGS